MAATGGWKGANTTPAAARHVTKEMERSLATEWMNYDTENKGKLTIHEVTELVPVLLIPQIKCCFPGHCC